MSSFGKTIKKFRNERKLTQRELAEKVGVDVTYISKIENDRLEHTPSLKTIRKLALVLGIDELELLNLAQKTPAILQDLAMSQEAMRFFRHASKKVKDPQVWKELLRYLEQKTSQE